MEATIVSVLEKVYAAVDPDPADIEYLLSIEDKDQIQLIFDFADRVRQGCVGQGILVRGIVEFSNFCRNRCSYCGLNKNNSQLTRYRLSEDEIMESVSRVVCAGIKTVILQSGEDEGLHSEWLRDIISAIKTAFDVAVTLSVVERGLHEYKMWHDAGADRYLLKIETSDKRLYETLHPGMSFHYRLECLRNLAILGYQIGSGDIVGLPGQTARMIADDILFFKEYQCDMIGIGPFIPHPRTLLADCVQGDAAFTLKTLAITRIVTKYSHVPATTALGSIESDDLRKEGLTVGANVLMVNFTPCAYRQWYELYPGKRFAQETRKDSLKCLAQSLGRTIDYSRGDALLVDPRTSNLNLAGSRAAGSP